MTIANCLPKLKEEWQKLKASEEKAGEVFTHWDGDNGMKD